MKWYIYYAALCASAFQFFYWGVHSESLIFISCSSVVFLAMLLIGFGMFLNRRTPIPPDVIIIPYFLFYLLYTALCVDFTVKWKLVAWVSGTVGFLCLFIPLLYDKIKRRRKD